MIVLKTSREIGFMRQAGRISARALKLAGEAVEPGVTTGEIDRIVRRYIESEGATPSFLGYGGFPASACISVNNEVIHGIPGHRVLKAGDIVSVDVGAHFKGFHGDNAWTYPCGDVSKEAQALMDVTRESLFEGIAQAKAGQRIGDISSAVQRYVEARGYSVVRQFVGHGVGASLHESPEVPNFGTPGRGARLLPGMTIAIEPMINEGSPDFYVDEENDWTVYTIDDGLSAQIEYMVLIKEDGVEILTK